MAFDIGNPADVQALRTEIETDPAGQGYRAPTDYFAAGATVALLNLLRQPDALGATNTLHTFSGEDLLASVIASGAEYEVVVTGHAQAGLRSEFMSRMFAYGEAAIPRRFHSALQAVFSQAQAPTIRAAIIAEITGPMRREEVLFGDDTVLSRADIAAALALP